MKRALLLFLLLCSIPALSQEYYGSHTIEAQFGPSFSPYSYSGEVSRVNGAVAGFAADLRYTWFFERNFGVYAKGFTSSGSAYEEDFFGVVNKADGEKYRYRFTSGYELCKEMKGACVGLAGRFDRSPFSLRPRLGIGVGEFSPVEYTYERQSRDGLTGTRFCTVKSVWEESAGPDYLIDCDDTYVSYYTTAFVLDASLQLCWTLWEGFFVSAEVGALYSPTRYSSRVSTMDSKLKYEPSNWVEAVAYADARDVWVKDESTAVSTVMKENIGSILRFSIGIGVNFGK